MYIIEFIMRNKSFDCARGIAAFIVVMYHIPLIINVNNPKNYVYNLITYPFKFGEQAVYFFMGLSGYVLALAYNKFTPTVNFLTWSGWRFIRLLPIYYFSLCVGYFLVSDANIRIIDWNHLYIFSNNSIYTGINPPLWSLSVEILISILLYLVFQSKFATDSKSLIVFSFILFIFSYLIDVWGVIAILRSVALFMIGISVASLNIVLNKIQKIVSFFIIIIWSALILYDKRILNSLLIPAILIILILLKDTNNRLLVNRFNLFLGNYSFSLYATHWISITIIQSHVKNFNWVFIYISCIIFSIFISVLVGKVVEFPSRKIASSFIHKFT